MKKVFVKNDSPRLQPYRLAVQVAFSLLCIWIGIEFYWFIRFLESGSGELFYDRPPGVDGFLPISSLMNVYQYLSTGVIHPYHPAGFFIFLTIIILSLVIGKSFCGWLCPVGFLSEYTGKLGAWVIQRKIRIPAWLDYPLRSVKYLMLGYLFYVIIWVMKTSGVWAFLDTPYNLMADVKMYYFFAELSRTGLIVLILLWVLSFFIRNFWCRYLCPYGAFLGWTSLLSVVRIRRKKETCIDCGLCARVCPSFIKVDKVKTVFSDECIGCMQCVDACPVKNTLELQVGRRAIPKRLVAAAIVILFLAGTGLGMITENWQNRVSKEVYLEHYQNHNQYGHPGMNR